MSNIAIILQARTGSSRLPRKIILPFYEGKTILEILLNRIKETVSDVPIIVATTTTGQDDEIEYLCNNLGVCTFRGSENDVLSRFILAAQKFNVNKVIRVCADNPFLDTASLKNLIDRFMEKDVDYMSFETSTGTPSIKTHYGLWAEAVKVSALEQIKKSTNDPLYHEHVTNYLYSHPDKFEISFMTINPYIEKHSSLRLTIDTKTDFQILQKIYKALITNKKDVTVNNLLEYLDKHLDIYDLMKRNIQENIK